jgi:hypothetical protein
MEAHLGTQQKATSPMTNAINPTTRKQILLDYIKSQQGGKVTTKMIAEALNVPLQYFVTDIRKWMDTPEFDFIHREGSGGAASPHRYWYDASERHAPLPPRTKHAQPRPTKKTPKVSSNLPEKVTPSFVRPGGSRATRPAGQMAMVIFQEGSHLILLDDQDRLIRGRLVE